MDTHLQFQILSIFNFYMPIEKYEICIKTFLQSVCWGGKREEAENAISIGFGPGHEKGMSPRCVSGCSP